MTVNGVDKYQKVVRASMYIWVWAYSKERERERGKKEIKGGNVGMDKMRGC